MPWEPNNYYRIKDVSSDAIHLSETLLQSYPVTRSCMGILGKRLLYQLEFGFFTEGQEIIQQGDTGKDLFLLCDNTVDVLVDGQRVVQMNAPALFGDKGIVEPKSIRAATIKVAENQTCFFIKIPMGYFIRDFNDKSISDGEFSQEVGIFYNMFKGIENRLFEFAFIQKNLWEEVNTTQYSVNIEQTLTALNDKTFKNWNDNIWRIVRDYLAKKLRIKWPKGVPFQGSVLFRLLSDQIDKTFPKASFEGTEAEFVKKRLLIWKERLMPIAESIVKLQPDDQLPVSIGEVELFNPRNYQIRIQALIRAIEKKFLLQNQKDDSGNDAQVGSSTAQELKGFFGRTERDNSFDLKRYLSSFENKFTLKHPKRMQLQIAQRTALTAAKCENEFNESVANMKDFLKNIQEMIGEKVQARSSEGEEKKIDLRKELSFISLSFNAYHQRNQKTTKQKVGKVIFSPTQVPTISELIKSSGSQQFRNGLNGAFKKVIDELKISFNLLSMEFIQQHIHVCDVSPGFEIPSSELEQHYWIPISKGIRILKGHADYGYVEPGTIVGGKGWIDLESPNDSKTGGSWRLLAPERKETDPMGKVYLLMILPTHQIPWEKNPDPHPDEFKKNYLPAMQWLVDKYLANILTLLPTRDILFENWLHTHKAVELEKRVKAFENSSVKITAQQWESIVYFLRNVVGLLVYADKPVPSHILSKQIYNHVLEQTKQDFKEASVQELGNKAYTKWRIILSEIIRMREEAEFEKNVNMASPVLEIIEAEIQTMLSSFTLEKYQKFVRLDQNFLSIYIGRILDTDEAREQDPTLLFTLIQSILETYYRLLIEEIRDYQQKLRNILKKRPKSDLQALEVESILDTAIQLRNIINQDVAAE
jgi:hypothetical protein